jgi:hypothetical protein
MGGEGKDKLEKINYTRPILHGGASTTIILYIKQVPL